MHATANHGVRRPLAVALASTPAWAGGDAAVLAANDSFYAALNEMFVGDIAPMEAVWSHADDVVFMGPNGMVRAGLER